MSVEATLGARHVQKTHLYLYSDVTKVQQICVDGADNVPIVCRVLRSCAITLLWFSVGHLSDCDYIGRRTQWELF